MWLAAASRTGCAGRRRAAVRGRPGSRHAKNEADKRLARALLKERVSLRGIARALKVSPGEVLSFFEAEAGELPEDLSFEPTRAGSIACYAVDIECDELWSFVRGKANKQRVWLALDADTRRIVAFHVGERSEEGARGLWNNRPLGCRQHATFYTDLWEACRPVIPACEHVPSDKGGGFAAYIERFNRTLRQRDFAAGAQSVVFLQEALQPRRRHQALRVRGQRLPKRSSGRMLRNHYL